MFISRVFTLDRKRKASISASFVSYIIFILFCMILFSNKLYKHVYILLFAFASKYILYMPDKQQLISQVEKVLEQWHEK